MQSSTWKAGLLLVLAALAGGAIGSALTVRTMDRHGFGRERRHGSEWYIELLQRELALTPTQRDSVHAILRRHSGDLDSVRSALAARLDQMRDTIRAEVRAQLTAPQVARYTDVTARLDAERREMMKKDSTDR